MEIKKDTEKRINKLEIDLRSLGLAFNELRKIKEQKVVKVELDIKTWSLWAHIVIFILCIILIFILCS